MMDSMMDSMIDSMIASAMMPKFVVVADLQKLCYALTWQHWPIDIRSYTRRKEEGKKEGVVY